MYLKKSNQNDYDVLLDGVKKFAWLPVKLDNEAIIWLEIYYETIKRHRITIKGSIERGEPFTSQFGVQTAKVKNIEHYKRTGEDE